MENSDLISPTSNIINVTEQTFMTEVVEVSKTTPVIVDFWAPWCEPCKTLTPLLEDAIKVHGQDLIFAKIDIDQNQNIAAQLRIQSIPTIYTFFEGKVVDGFQGAKSNSEIVEFIKKAASLSGPGEEVANLILSAKEFIKLRDWNSSFEISQKILEKDPENQDGFANLIRSMIGLDKFNETKELINNLAPEIKNSKSVEEAISLLETSEKAFVAKGSIEDLEKKLKQDPNNLDHLLQMAIALFGVGQIEDSFDMLLKSIKIDKEWNEQAARKQLLEFFSSAGIEAKETITARKKTSDPIIFLVRTNLMVDNLRQETKLPNIIPLFPLKGVVMFPDTYLPLNIFEPRYLKMIDQAFLNEDRLIGMIQPQNLKEKEDKLNFYNVGCAGKIVKLEETEDNRYLITLKGLSRFNLISEKTNDKNFREAKVAWKNFTQDLNTNPKASDFSSLKTTLKKYFKSKYIRANMEVIDTFNDYNFVDQITMICPLANNEKQLLLETISIVKREKLLKTILDSYITQENISDMSKH